MRLLLLLMMAALLAGCQQKPEELFQSLWGETNPFSLRIIKTVRSKSPYFAVFAHVSKGDFLSFQQTSIEFITWHPVADEMVFEIGKTELHAPADISGTYSMGRSKEGYVRVIVWDEKSETVVIMGASGIM